MRAVVPLAAVVAWLAALGLEAWLGGRLLSADVVAGLISPQGVDVAGLAEIAAFLAARLVAVLVLPALVAAAMTWAATGRRR